MINTPWAFRWLPEDVQERIGAHPPEVEFVVAVVIDQDSDDPPPSFEEALRIAAAKYDLDKDAVLSCLKKARLVRKVTECLKQGKELRASEWVRWLRRMSLL